MLFVLLCMLYCAAQGIRLSLRPKAAGYSGGRNATGMPDIPEPCSSDSCVVLSLTRASSSELDQVVPPEIPSTHVADRNLFKRSWSKMLKLIRPADAVAVLTTGARLAVWGTALGLTIAFPPASLAVAGSAAFLGFLVTAASTIARDGNLNIFKSPQGWCSLFTQVAQDLFVGVTGGINAAVPAIILSADALEALVTDWKGVTGVSHNAFMCGKIDLTNSLEEIRSKRHQSALALMSALPWLDHIDCPCEQCLEPLLPGAQCHHLERVCHPSWAHKYAKGICQCNIQAECYGNDTAGFAEILLSQTKALLKAD